MRRAEWVVGGAAALSLLGGCLSLATHSANADRPAPSPSEEPHRGPDLSKQPTEDQARSQLAVLVEAALTRDRARYCAAVEFKFLCEEQWDRAGGAAAIPDAPPHLLGLRPVRGGRVLILCGLDGFDRPYRSELPVMMYDNGPRVMGGPYWQNVTFSGVHTDDPGVVIAPRPEPSLPAECLS